MQILTVQQFREWQIYYDCEPWGSLEDDEQGAFTRKIMLEAQGAKRKDGSPFSITDYSLSFMREKNYEALMEKKKGIIQEQSPDEMKNILLGINKR